MKCILDAWFCLLLCLTKRGTVVGVKNIKRRMRNGCSPVETRWWLLDGVAHSKWLLSWGEEAAAGSTSSVSHWLSRREVLPCTVSLKTCTAATLIQRFGRNWRGAPAQSSYWNIKAEALQLCSSLTKLVWKEASKGRSGHKGELEQPNQQAGSGKSLHMSTCDVDL